MADEFDDNNNEFDDVGMTIEEAEAEAKQNKGVLSDDTKAFLKTHYGDETAANAVADKWKDTYHVDMNKVNTDIFGSSAEYASFRTWVSKHATPEERQALNTAFNGDVEEYKLQARELRLKYKESGGVNRDPRKRPASRPANSGGQFEQEKKVDPISKEEGYTQMTQKMFDPYLSIKAKHEILNDIMKGRAEVVQDEIDSGTYVGKSGGFDPRFGITTKKS